MTRHSLITIDLMSATPAVPAETPCIDLMSELPGAAGTAPDWIQLLPAGTDGLIRTADGRGPYRIADMEELARTSLQGDQRLMIDENHAEDRLAPLGMPAPARGWVVELQARADGIWGRVEWTPTGQELVATRAYRGISPAIAVQDEPGGMKRILRILRASLVNRPNLRGLAALHQETDMTLAQRLAKLLGLDAAATDQQILDAVETLNGKAKPELQSQLAEIGTALGAADGADAAAILAAARAARTAPATGIVELQAELATVTTQLNQVRAANARTSATAFIDGEIRRGRVGVKALRDHYIEQHMADAARVEKEIGALPILGASGALAAPPSPGEAGRVELNSTQIAIATRMGLTVEAYAEVVKSERAQMEAL